jgi:hypothetical protein
MTAATLALALAVIISLGAANNASAQTRDTTKAKTPAATATSATPACCLVVRVDANDGALTARETATGFTFRVVVKDRRRLASVKVGNPVWADFATKTVKLKANDVEPCCNIVETPPTGGVTPPAPSKTPEWES